MSSDYICSVDDNAELNQAEFFLIKLHIPLKWIERESAQVILGF